MRARLRARLADERGMALVLAMAIMLVFGIATVSVISYTMSNSTAASSSSASQVAYNLADGGLTRAIAILQDASAQTHLTDQPQTLLPLTPTSGLPSTWTVPAPFSTTWSYREGTARAWGTFIPDSYAGLTMGGLWRVTATGTVSYAAGGRTQQITRKVSADVPVTPSTEQTLTTDAWHYVYSWNTGSQCDETIYNNTTVSTSMYVKGNLCLQTPSSITGPSPDGTPVNLIVLGYVDLESNTDIGKTKALSSQPAIVGGCYNSFSGWKATCSSGTGFAVTPGSTNSPPPAIAPPTANFPAWYHYAKPGPGYPCDPSKSSAPSTWPQFDNNTVLDNSLPTVVDLTPATAYTCMVDATHYMSWAPSSKKLTIYGTIYTDGSVTSTASPVDFDGSGAIYMSGTFLLKNATFCVEPKTNNACDGATWGSQTSPQLLVIATNGVGSGGSGPQDQVPTGDGIEIKSSSFQGALYGTHTIEVDTTSNVQAPMVSGTEIISQHGGSPFPQLLQVPFGIPGVLPTVFDAGQPRFYRDG